MAREYSAHQRKLIRRYYENLDDIRAQKLGELVTEIFLATTAKRQDALWTRAAKLLEEKNADPERVEAVQAVLEARDVEALAELAGQQFG